jgi:hypothetical protein
VLASAVHPARATHREPDVAPGQETPRQETTGPNTPGPGAPGEETRP